MYDDLPPRFGRREYTQGNLRLEDLVSDPIEQFAHWMADAIESGGVDPNAMTLATVDVNGAPDARIVLLKSVDLRGFIFCTSLTSPKGRQIESCNYAAMVFYWSSLDRQVRVTGEIKMVSRQESNLYFQERPRESQIAAMVFQQSETIDGRECIDNRFVQLEREFAGKEIPLPDHWSGFLLIPNTVEFWQGGIHRLHDRFKYTRVGDGKWDLARLAP